MVMDFTFSDEVDLSGLANGQAIDFKMEKTDTGQFQVTEVSKSDNTMATEFWVEGDITMLMADGGMTRVVLSEGEGKYRSHRIRVGREAGDRVEVLEGLEQGVSVVTSAHFMLDSESSQTADLSRISSINEEPMQMSDSVWARGSITNLMVGYRMATIEHQPVPEWDWPGMVMDFTFSDEVDLSGLANGQAIDFKMEKTDSGQFQVTEVSQSDNTMATEVWVEGDITMLMADFGMITVDHQAVDEWQWQAGEMNFTASDDIPLDDYKEGQKVRFLVVKSGTDYVLKKIESAEE
jgi:Cu(I)/Ag(I) efflux system membrane fusion protein